MFIKIIQVTFETKQVLNPFSPDLQINNTESVIRNKLKDILTELKGF